MQELIKEFEEVGEIKVILVLQKIVVALLIGIFSGLLIDQLLSSLLEEIEESNNIEVPNSIWKLTGFISLFASLTLVSTFFTWISFNKWTSFDDFGKRKHLFFYLTAYFFFCSLSFAIYPFTILFEYLVESSSLFFLLYIIFSMVLNLLLALLPLSIPYKELGKLAIEYITLPFKKFSVYWQAKNKKGKISWWMKLCKWLKYIGLMLALGGTIASTVSAYDEENKSATKSSTYFSLASGAVGIASDGVKEWFLEAKLKELEEKEFQGTINNLQGETVNLQSSITDLQHSIQQLNAKLTEVRRLTNLNP